MTGPTGPLPPGVYLRRRVVAGVLTIGAVGLLIWIIGSLVGTADDQPPLSGMSARTSQPPLSTRPPATSTTVPVTSRAGAVPASSPPPPPSPPSPSPSPPPPPPSPPPPGPCPDSAVQVLAATGAPAYPVGQRPLLLLAVVNTGQVPCVREVGRSSRELIITSGDGATRVWSSNDCYPAAGEESRLLQPGERLEFTVKWAGRTSAPGCPSNRTTVPAGTYLVTAELGALASAPVPLELTAG